MNAGEGLTAAEAAGAVPGDGPLAGAGAGAEARARACAAVRAHLAEAFAAHPAVSYTHLTLPTILLV